GGVFISDVVGLGKTYIAAMLAGQLDGRTLVVAPPVLLDTGNPGSWSNVFSDFRVPADFQSIGKLDELLKKGVEKYTNVIIDEAHRFRTESNVTYEKLAEVCRGRRVILVTATPYNNSPKDILSQIKLFQNAKKSMIPNLPNLEVFFNGLDKKLKNLDRQKDYKEYIDRVRENAKEIRDKVLKYLMVRRTRMEITRFFSQDLDRQKLRFPGVEAPIPLFYELDDHEDGVFNRTIELAAQKFSYARYTPLLYYKGKKIDQLERQSQENMGKFMKILLVKRLESSFHAFRNSIDRFIGSYEQFIQEYDKGNVYVSKKHAAKIFELLENDDDEAIQRLIDEGKAQVLKASDFYDNFRPALQTDLAILREIKEIWSSVTRDPKLDTFIGELKKNKDLKENKLIIFTESKETAEYLAANIDGNLKGAVLSYNGSSGEAIRDRVSENCDAKAKHKKDDYRILVSTEVLSEGVNLHRANVVINYDIPWNPTRMMQRVGRINRVDTPFDKIHTFTFFPTKQSNDQIKLQEAAESKINAFLTLLGGDAALLTEGEPVGSHELFNRLLSAKTITGEDDTEESELKYLNIIKDIRGEEPGVFDTIKRLPKKARTARESVERKAMLLTYFRRGKLHKFFLAGEAGEAEELDFLSTAKLLEATPETPRQKSGKDYYELLSKNKEAFLFATEEEILEPVARGGGRDSPTQLLRTMKAVMKDIRQLTEDQESYVKRIMLRLEEGAIPKQTAKEALKALAELKNDLANPLKVLGVLQASIPARLLEEHFAAGTGSRTGRREVILSEYLTGW
ncbi:MAG: DEAD/DEAH box helicase, partial [Candidatus Gracilibacteria bacterium]|nr:DEAD/DEAH box helicase [Candidatus Gracilibacteria bacterium]